MPHYDYLVIGSGLAGMSFAEKVARHGRVALVTKRALQESNTAWAQGGIAAVWTDEDSIDSHVADTVEAGAGLCNERVVKLIAEEGPRRIRELIDLGVQFSPSPSDPLSYDLGLEGGHSHRRILHQADKTGQEVVRALTQVVRSQSNIDIYENHLAIDLLIDEKFGFGGGRPHCWGAYILNTQTGDVETFTAGATLLATGGSGKVYLYTSNPDVASGDGIALAYRAGCRVADMEFIQFHPTCLYHHDAKSFLVSEAMRGEGAVLRRPDGSPFMSEYDSRLELAPRDIVARAIDTEMKTSGFDHVLLDITERGAPFIQKRFPAIHERCLGYGIDITQQAIPVVPAAHYQCGGVMTGTSGETAIQGLYAAGEVAMTGLHGANRLASNSLLEAVVMASRTAEAVLDSAGSGAGPPPRFPAWATGQAVNIDESVVISHNWDEIRRLMWNYVGIARSDRRLERAAARIAMLREEIRQYYWDFLVTRDLLELRNIAVVAELVIRCARSRRESRGLHFNVDCPERDDSQIKHTVA
jgi:L-aspartate oxidase